MADARGDGKNMKRKTPRAAPVEIRAADFQSAVLAAKLPVLAVFTAAWSQPCKILSATLAEVAAACAGRVKVVWLNADDCPDLGLWYEIESVPTLLFFSDGALRARIVGTASKTAILEKLKDALAEEK